MRIYVHIPNCSDFMDEDVQVAVECSGVPRKGEIFYLSDEDTKSLINQIINNGKGSVWAYSSWINEVGDCRYIGFDDCIYVTDVCWKKSKSGEYECHIELSDDLTDDTTPSPMRCSDEEFEKVFQKVVAEHNKL